MEKQKVEVSFEEIKAGDLVTSEFVDEGFQRTTVGVTYKRLGTPKGGIWVDKENNTLALSWEFPPHTTTYYVVREAKYEVGQIVTTSVGKSGDHWIIAYVEHLESTREFKYSVDNLAKHNVRNVYLWEREISSVISDTFTLGSKVQSTLGRVGTVSSVSNHTVGTIQVKWDDSGTFGVSTIEVLKRYVELTEAQRRVVDRKKISIAGYKLSIESAEKAIADLEKGIEEIENGNV